jgi:RHS repeat-associated protein
VSLSRATEFTYDDVGRVVAERTLELDPLPVEKIRIATTYDPAGRRTAVEYFTDGATTAADEISFTYDAHDRLTSTQRAGTLLLSANAYNPDGTLGTQTTPAGTATFSYDRRDRLVGATSPLFTGTAAYAWTNDDVLATRAWPGGTEATYAYDAARRPTGMTVENGTTSVADFGRTLDRVGNVTSESQALDGVTGLAGSETQSFTYDALRRLSTSQISDGTTSDARSYSYDAGSRRTSKTENGVVTAYAYDRNDQLVSQTVAGGSAESFAYDAYGRMTTRASGGGAVTTYTYDAADRLVGITAPGGDPETFTLDALGRKWTRSLDGTLTDTYTYVDATYGIVRIEQPSLTVDSAIDAIGTRIATRTSDDDFGFALPDLHGNFAAAMGAGATISDPFRYDGYGQTLASATSDLPTPWRFQGKPLLSDVSDDLYDFESRAYDPGTGTFTQLDTVTGSIQDPLTLNRFLYAHANPSTLIDPDGHAVYFKDGFGNARSRHSRARVRDTASRVAKANQATRNYETIRGINTSRIASNMLGAAAAPVAVAVSVVPTVRVVSSALAAVRAVPAAIAAAGHAAGAWTANVAVATATSGLAGGCAAGACEFLRRAGIASLDVASGTPAYHGGAAAPLVRAGAGVGANAEALLKGTLLAPTRRNVEIAARRAGIGLDNVGVEIGTYDDAVRYLDQAGAIGSASGGSMIIGPAAFESLETLIATVAHERMHVYQQAAGFNIQLRRELEAAASAIEDTFVRYALGGR